MHRIIFSILIINVFAGFAFGQQFIRVDFTQPATLTASAGADTLVCTNHPVQLGGNPSATGGNQSYVFLWTPTDGLNDPTSSNPIATISESRSYTLQVMDGGGCLAVSTVNVYVDPCLGTDENQLNQVITVFPNPSDGIISIDGINNLKGRIQNIEVLNQLGQVVFEKHYESGNEVSDYIINTQIKEPGVYFLRITLPGRVVSNRLIIR